jgi:hypothetical protein
VKVEMGVEVREMAAVEGRIAKAMGYWAVREGRPE